MLEVISIWVLLFTVFNQELIKKDILKRVIKQQNKLNVSTTIKLTCSKREGYIER